MAQACASLQIRGLTHRIDRFDVLNDMVNPLAIALNAVPIVVLVSVFNNQFATTSEVPRRLMVTLIVYFVVLVNVAKGLRQVQTTHLELLRSYAASPIDVPSSSATRSAIVRAATRRGWVWPIIPARPRPASRHSLGSWVLLPEPVSPATITTGWSRIAVTSSSRRAVIGSDSG